MAFWSFFSYKIECNKFGQKFQGFEDEAGQIWKESMHRFDAQCM